MENQRDRNALVGGVVLMALGLLFLLGNFGYFPWDLWGRWWPLVLIGIGLIILLRRPPERETGGAGPVPQAGEPSTPGEPAEAPARPTRPGYPTGAIILIGLGVAFLLEDYLGGNAFPALVLIVIGAALLLRDRPRR